MCRLSLPHPTTSRLQSTPQTLISKRTCTPSWCRFKLWGMTRLHCSRMCRAFSRPWMPRSWPSMSHSHHCWWTITPPWSSTSRWTLTSPSIPKSYSNTAPCWPGTLIVSSLKLKWWLVNNYPPRMVWGSFKSPTSIIWDWGRTKFSSRVCWSTFREQDSIFYPQYNRVAINFTMTTSSRSN